MVVDQRSGCDGRITVGSRYNVPCQPNDLSNECIPWIFNSSHSTFDLQQRIARPVLKCATTAHPAVCTPITFLGVSLCSFICDFLAQPSLTHLRAQTSELQHNWHHALTRRSRCSPSSCLLRLLHAPSMPEAFLHNPHPLTGHTHPYPLQQKCNGPPRPDDKSKRTHHLLISAPPY